MASNSEPKVTFENESFILDPEAECHRNTLTARTITLFHFEGIKSGKPITPLWENSTPEFWDRSGYWDILYEGLHIAHMDITGITGMFLEKDRTWRGNLESILWVHTRKCAYALQLPCPEYANIWTRVVENWERSHPGLSAAFHPISAMGDRPAWWGNDQEKQWRKLVEKYGPDSKGKGKAREREEADQDGEDRPSDDDDGDDDAGDAGRARAGPSGSGRGKRKATATAPARVTRGQVKAKRSGAEDRRSARPSTRGKGKGKALSPEPEPESNSLPVKGDDTEPESVPSRRRRSQASGDVATPSEGRSKKRVRVALSSSAGPSDHSNASPLGSPIKPTPAIAVGGDTAANDNLPRPSKKPRTVSTTDNQGSGDVAGPAATDSQSLGAGSSSSAAKKVMSASEWATRRREAAESHKKMRAVSETLAMSSEQGRPLGSSSARQSAPPSRGQFPPPTSSPITSSNVWTTRPLTQVAPPTVSQSTEGAETNNDVREASEADMSLDSGTGEGENEGGTQATITTGEPDRVPSPRRSSTPVAQTPGDKVIARTIETSEKAKQLIKEVTSRRQAGTTSSDIGEAVAGQSTTDRGIALSPVAVALSDLEVACVRARGVLKQQTSQQLPPESSSPEEGGALVPGCGSGTSRTDASALPGDPAPPSATTGGSQPLPAPPEGSPEPQPSVPAPTNMATTLSPSREPQPLASTSQSEPSTSVGGSIMPNDVEHRMRVLDITLERREKKRPATEKRVVGNPGKQ